MKRKTNLPTAIKKKKVKHLVTSEDRVHIENSHLLHETYFDIPDFLSKITSFQLESISSLGIHKPGDCKLLPGSLLDANNLVGLDISRSTYTENIEKTIENGNKIVQNTLQEIYHIQKKILKYILDDDILKYNGKRIGDKFQLEKGILHKNTRFKIIKNKNVETLSIKFGRAIENFSIEADVPIVIENSDQFPNYVCVVSERININGDLKCKIACLIGLALNIQANIKCNALIIRVSTVNISTITATTVITICNDFTSKDLIIAENLIIDSQRNIIVDKTNIEFGLFDSKHITFKNNSHIKKMFSKNQKLFVKSDIKIDNLYTESHKVTIDGSLESIIACFYLIYEKNGEITFVNNNVAKFNDLIIDSIPTDITENIKAMLKNKSGFSVTNAFLLMNGLFENSYNAALRGIYLTKGSSFETLPKGSVSVGDLIVIEDGATFKNLGLYKTYSHIRPTVLSCGAFISSKNLFEVAKFVSCGQMDKNAIIKANDVVSINCRCDLECLDVECPLFVLGKNSLVKADECRVKAECIEKFGHIECKNFSFDETPAKPKARFDVMANPNERAEREINFTTPITKRKDLEN